MGGRGQSFCKDGKISSRARELGQPAAKPGPVPGCVEPGIFGALENFRARGDGRRRKRMKALYLSGVFCFRELPRAYRAS